MVVSGESKRIEKLVFSLFQIFNCRLIGTDHKALHTNHIFIHTEHSLLTAARLTYNGANQRVWSLMDPVYEKAAERE